MSPMLLLIVELSIYIFYCVISLLLCGVAATVFWRVQLRGKRTGVFGSWLLTMLSTLSIGLLVGGAAKNSKQASVIACILYFPMLIFFPAQQFRWKFCRKRCKRQSVSSIYYGGCADEKKHFWGLSQKMPWVQSA